MKPTTDYEIVVLGAGPAGAAVAISLARLGWQVAVVGSARGFAACEAISERTLGGLRDAGLHHAARTVAEPSPRETCWNGTEFAANTERLLLRAVFDAALTQDLRDAAVACFATRARTVNRADSENLEVALSDGTRLCARFVVDARGRSAPQGRSTRVRGPETVSILQQWQGMPCIPGSSVFGFATGWAWCARLANGTRYTQLTLTAGGEGPPKQRDLPVWLTARIAEIPRLRAFVDGCVTRGATVARASTAVLQLPLHSTGVLRVGDAAMAVDPLSGNGIFQALSSASVAPAVINTLLREPNSGALAMRFYDERVRHIFERFSRVGRDFYRAETRWPGQPFWAARSNWPDDQPSHDTFVPQVLGVASRPVVEAGFVRERAVVITSDQPLGVWRVDGVEIAALLADLPVDPPARSTMLSARIADATGGNRALQKSLAAWCRKYALISA